MATIGIYLVTDYIKNTLHTLTKYFNVIKSRRMSDFVFWGNRPWRAISNWMSIICIHLLNIKTCFNLFESPVFQNGYQSFCSTTNVSQLTILFNVIIIILMFSANSEWLAELRKEEDERIAEWSKNYRDRVIKVLYKTIICWWRINFGHLQFWKNCHTV